MNSLGILATALFAVAISVSASDAQTSDLVGTWTTGETTVILESDNEEIVEVPRTFTIVIESVHGSVVQGSRTWKATTDDPGYVDEDPVLNASEPFIGALSSDGKTLRLVEVDDEGLMFGTRIGDDKIEITYMEAAPHAVAYTAVYERQK